jgi:hypothetical protein
MLAPAAPTVRSRFHRWATVRAAIALGLAAAAQAACLGSSTASVSPTSPPPAPTPTADVRVRLTRWHIDPGGGEALGFVALEGGPESSDLALDVTLLDDRDQATATVRVPALTPYLLRSSEAFFAARFPEGSVGSALQVSVASHQPAPQDIEALDATILSSTWLTGESLSLLGRLGNAGRRPLTPSGLLVVGLDEDGDPMTFAEGTLAVSALRPGESAPFRADVPDATGVEEWLVISHGVPAPSAHAASVRLDGDIAIRRDAQGQWFAVGGLMNTSDTPRWARVGVLLKVEDHWLSLGLFETPVGLPPGARLPFLIEGFPGIEQQEAEGNPDEDSVQAASFLSEREAATVVRSLEAELTGYEVIGSRLYLRGQVRNPGTSRIGSAAVVISVTSADGDRLTAGWAAVSGSLDTGEQAGFLAILPIPAGLDLSLAEFDLRSLGAED